VTGPDSRDPAPWWEGVLALAASWAIVLGRPGAYWFSGDACTFLWDAAGFPTSSTIWDLCYPTPAGIYHGPLTGLMLVPIAHLPVDTMAHLMLWAGLVGLSPLLLWAGLRKELPRAALPVALGLAVSPAFSLGIRHFSSPGVMPLFLALAVGPLLAGHRTGRWTSLLWAGLWAGLAAGSHLAGLMLLPPLAVATWRWRRVPAAWLGLGLYLLLSAVTMVPPVLVKSLVLFLVDSGSGSPKLLNYTIVLLLGGLLPAAGAIALIRARRRRPGAADGPPWWRRIVASPSWWMMATGLAMMFYLSVPANYVYPHYFDVAIVGLLLVLAPVNVLERRVLLVVFGACLAVQLGMMALMPLDGPPRYHTVVQDTEELCRGDNPIPKATEADSRPYRYMMERLCPGEPIPEP